MNAIDTNILLYTCDKSDVRRHALAVQVVRQTRGGILPWQVAVEFIGAARRLETRGFTRQIAWNRLNNFLRLYSLFLPNQQTLDAARILHIECNWSYWDALIVGTCQVAGVTRLYSEDLPGGNPPAGLEIVNPFV